MKPYPFYIINMKAKFFLQFFSAVIALGLLAGCSAASKEEDKKARLQSLREQQANLTKEIAVLEEQVAKENPADSANIRAKQVAVAELAPQKFDHYIQTQGRIESDNNIIVSAKVPGVVTRVHVTEGQQVAKGQLLASLDNGVIEQNLASMESQLELARSVFERQEKLWKQKIGTEVQYLQVKTNKESLEKQIASVREQNDMYRITAPIAGTVDEVNAKVGEAAQPGAPAFRVVNGSDLKLRADVSEAYVTTVKKGNKVTVSLPEHNKEIQATVTFVGRNIDVLSRTFPVEVKLPAMEYLRPNMTATIKIVFNTEASALVVPVNVIQTIKDEKIIYVAETKGNATVARRRVVTVDGVFGSKAQVTGLNAGDKIITVGYQGLNDGDFVKI